MQLPNGKAISRLLVQGRIKVPKEGKGLWSAFWMAPKNETKYGKWPASGEVGAAWSGRAVWRGLPRGAALHEQNSPLRRLTSWSALMTRWWCKACITVLHVSLHRGEDSCAGLPTARQPCSLPASA